MKKLVLAAIFINSLSIVHAQNLNGKLFAGGSLGFDFMSADANTDVGKYTNPKANQSYSINPSVGYYLNDKLAIGLQFGYNYATKNTLYLNYYGSPSSITATTETFSIAPLLRYTIPITDKFGFNINTTIPYSHSRNTLTDTSSKTSSGTANGNIAIPNGNNSTSTSFGLNVSPGFQWFVKDQFAIFGSFGAFSYSYVKTDGNVWNSKNNGPYASTQSNDFKLSLSTSISFGVTFYFGGRK
jgi:hypothetical protein